jgi:hypothetical protein
LKHFVAEIPAALLAAYSAAVAAIVSVFNAVDGFFSRRALKRGVSEVKDIAFKTKGGVDAVQEHTDGMLKTMLDSAKVAGHKAGTEQATQVAEVKADALAKGQAEGREQAKKE